MKYTFPEIRHIDDVLPAIEGRDEFIVAERPWGKVVNYLVVMPDTFPPVQTAYDAIRRECRGLVFNTDGTIMARRLHKFFNVNERPETQIEHLDLSQPHVIMEKLDGSMITPLWVNGEVRWGTKMGINDISAQAEEFAKSHPQYYRMVETCRKLGLTPIFEWCSRQQRIVIDHPRDRLVLLAIRDNVTGAYKDRNFLIQMRNDYLISLVRVLEGTMENMEALVAHTRDLSETEGFVLQFADGHMVKVKSDWYVRIHKTKDNLLFEKNVIDMIVNEKMDDVKSFMLAEDRVRVEEFEREFWSGFDYCVKRYERLFIWLKQDCPDKKTYALKHMKEDGVSDHFLPALMFGAFDGKDMRSMVLDKIRQNLSTQSKVDSVRHMWSGARWSFQFETDG